MRGLAAPADKSRIITQPLVDSKPLADNQAESKPLAVGDPHFLQAGSFSKADDAAKIQARLALLGLESSIQTATIPDKGVWYRVRLGPYKDMDELNRTRDSLKQNGVEATPTRTQ